MLKMSSSPNLEGLEIKEATPSIAPSIYESLQYTRKWRIILAIGIGVLLIGVCILAFHLSAKARIPARNRIWSAKNISTEEPIVEPSWQWRTLNNDECFITSKLATACPEDFGDKVALLIAFGGLRPDQVNEIPALSEFIRCGVSAHNLVPTYPTYTFTNLYTIATGLYAESHGIISDEMYDPVHDMNFTIGTPSAYKSEWWGGEPLWITAKKKGKQSATYLWPGSDVRIQNHYPVYWEKEETSFEQRIIKVLDWIRLPIRERPELIMMYYDGPSQSAQRNGIFSDTTDKVLRDIGFGLDELIAGLEREDLSRCVNMVIVSDHGIAPSHCDESIFLDDILSGSNTARVFTGPVGRLMFSNEEDENQVTEKLQCQDMKLRALTKDRIPKRYHYTNNPRIGGIILDTKVGSRVALEDINPCLEGDFGYNNLAPSMQGVFIGHGPAFKSDFKIPNFRNVEIYNLICLLLDLDPAPNNGTIDSLFDILKDDAFNKTVVNSTEEFLAESYKSRPLRKEDSVVGIRDVDDELAEEICQCDYALIMDKTTMPSSTISIINTETTESSRIPKGSTKLTESIISDTATITEKLEELTTATTIDMKISSSGSSTENKSDVDKIVTTSDNSASTQTSGGEKLLNRKKRTTGDHSDERTSVIDVRNDTAQFTKQLLELHAPWGIPSYTAPEVKSDNLNILSQTSYVIGFPESLNLPIWSSFTLTPKKIKILETYTPSVPDGVKVDKSNLKNQIPLGCWMADWRLSRSSNDQCSRTLQTNLYSAQNISLRQLFPEELELPELLSSEGFLLTNLSPIRKGYENGGRNAIMNALKKWTLAFGAINIIHGPVFDYNFDGRRDLTTEIRDKIKPIVASDFFYVISFCNITYETDEGELDEETEIQRLKSCSLENLKTFCFVFPNTDIDDNCFMTAHEYMLYHISSLWDVQTLTGLKFYKKLTPAEYVKRSIHQPLTIPVGLTEENKVLL